MYLYMYIYTYVYLFMYVCMYVYMYVYIFLYFSGWRPPADYDPRAHRNVHRAELGSAHECALVPGKILLYIDIYRCRYRLID